MICGKKTYSINDARISIIIAHITNKGVYMDKSLETYYNELLDAIKAMMALKPDMDHALHKVVLANFWQAQSGFNYKIEKENKINSGER